MDPYERSARFWLRAYPPRWRAVRGDELLGTLRDVAAPDATRLAAREARGLLRAGWATRWRTGPPLRTRLGYLLLGTRIPAQHREWARDDIAGRWYATRRLARTFLPLLVWLVALPMVLLGSAPAAAAVAPMAGVMLVAMTVVDLRGRGDDRVRRTAVRLQLMPRPGEPVVPGGLGRGAAPRTRLRASAGAGLALGTVAAVGLAATAVTLAAPYLPAVVTCPGSCVGLGSVANRPGRLAVPVAVATVLGLVLAAVVNRRWARLVGDRPAQPARRLVGAADVLDALLAVVAIGTGCTVLAWHEVNGPLPAVLGPATALACLAAAPVLVAALRTARRGPADLAGVDLWQIAVLGRPPRVDAPADAVVRLAPPPSPGS